MIEIKEFSNVQITGVKWLIDIFGRNYIPIDKNIDQLLYLYFRDENKSYFGALYNGKYYSSKILWINRSKNKNIERTIYNLIQNGLSPYQALEFMEL